MLADVAPESESAGALQEVVVTANRREENLQDVPITIQALTAETLTQLNVQTFDDFVHYLPNVTASSFGPGQGDINMRGLSVGGSGGTQGDASAGVAKGSWSTQLYAENFTDTRALLSSSYAEFVKMNTINRPRTLGLRFSYRLQNP